MLSSTHGIKEQFLSSGLIQSGAMIEGTRVNLRPVREEDLATMESWGQGRAGLWGSYQRFQLDHLAQLQEAFAKDRMLTRDSGLLLIERREDRRVVGLVRYALASYPDADSRYPDIGFLIGDVGARGQGLAREAVALLVDYLFAGYPTERIAASTDIENEPARRLLEALGFRLEGILRRAYFRDGRWSDLGLYSVLRSEWKKPA